MSCLRAHRDLISASDSDTYKLRLVCQYWIALVGGSFDATGGASSEVLWSIRSGNEPGATSSRAQLCTQLSTNTTSSSCSKASTRTRSSPSSGMTAALSLEVTQVYLCNDTWASGPSRENAYELSQVKTASTTMTGGGACRRSRRLMSCRDHNWHVVCVELGTHEV